MGRGRGYALIAALWFVLYGSFALVRPPLLDDADSVHAEVAREMVARHDWVTLYANGIRYLEKAPLLYWSMAVSFRLFGPETWAARLPLALLTLLLLLVVAGLGRALFRSEGAGLLSAVVLATSFGLFIFTRILIPDALVCLWLTVAMLCFWRSLSKPTRATAAGFGAACALGVLTKGLIGLVFPLAIVGAYLLATRDLRHLRRWNPWLGALVFFAIAAPWHIAAGLANPTVGHPAGRLLNPAPSFGNVRGFFWFYFVNEHLLRYLNRRVPRDYDTVPLALFWGLLLVWMLPWSAFLARALARVPMAAWWRREPLAEAGQARLLLLIWVLVPMLFFSFSTRQEYYCLPAMPALALLLGGSLAEEADAGMKHLRTAWALFALGCVGAGAALFSGLRAEEPRGELSAVLNSHPGDYALSFGHFLDLSTQAMAFFRTPLLLTAVALLGGTGAHLLLRRAGHVWSSLMALGAAGVLFLAAAHMALVTFSPVLSSARLADALRPLLRPGDVIVIDGEYEGGSTLAFYLHQPLHLLNGRSSNLWYGSFFPDAPQVFEDDASFARLWSGSQRIFLLTDRAQRLALPGTTYAVAEDGGKQVLSNRR